MWWWAALWMLWPAMAAGALRADEFREAPASTPASTSAFASVSTPSSSAPSPDEVASDDPSSKPTSEPPDDPSDVERTEPPPLPGVSLSTPPGEDLPAQSADDVPIKPRAVLPSARTHGLWVGTVTMAGSKDTVAGARVVPLDGSPDFDADGDGVFERWLAPGRHAFLIRAEGFEDLRVDVVVTLGERVELQYRLLEDLDRRKYRTTVTDDAEVGVSRTRLQGEEIRNVPGTRGDPFNVVKSLPGVNQIAGFLPYVVVRGAAPGNTGYFIDGLRVPLLFHVAAGPSVIHPYFIDSVDFYPSGAPVRLGRFASGMIEGRTRKARSDRLRGDFDLRLTDAGGLLEIPFGRPVLPGCREQRRRDCARGKARGSIAVAGRYSYLGLLLSAVPRLNARINFWDFQTRLDVDLGPRATYRAFVYGARDVLGRAQAIRDDPETGMEETYRPDPELQFEFYRLDQSVRHDLPSGGEARYQVGLGYDRTGVAAGRVDVWRVMPRLRWVQPLREGVRVAAGVDMEAQFHRLSDPIGDVGDPESLSYILSNRDVLLAAVWTDLRWRRGRVELRPGLRLDAYLQNGESGQLLGVRKVSRAFGVDPRILARVRVHPRWVLRQSIGAYHQPPDLPIPLPGIEAFGFEQGLQRNIQGTFGYEFEIPGVAVLTQDVYVGRLSNLQDFELSSVGDSDELDDVLESVNGWTYGLETMLKLDPRKRFFGWVAYTLARSVREYDIGGRAPSSWDQTHIFNLVLGYRLGQKWSFGGRLHAHTGRPYTPTANISPSFEELATRRNAARLPGFFQVDLRVDRIWLRDDYEVRLFFDLANAGFNVEVLSCDGTGDPGGRSAANPLYRLAVCGDNRFGIPYLVPGLGVRGRF